MWTPRRILLLMAAVFAFGAAFVVYNSFLGWIDGLPALPAKFLPSTNQLIGEDIPLSDNRMDRKLRITDGRLEPRSSP